MSDSEDSTVTYTEAPPSPEFIPEPVDLKFMPPEDEVFPTKEQPDSDPEEDPEEDPADYHADGGDDDDDDDESSDDNEDDDDVEEDEDEDEEEEHPALADSVPPPPVYRTTARISIPAQALVPFLFEADVDRLLAIRTPPPSPLTPLSSPLPQIPSPPLPVSSPLPVSPLLLPASPTHLLGYRAAMIQLRAKSPSTSHSLQLPPPIILSRTRSDAPRLGTPPSGTPPLLPIPAPTSSPPLLLPSTNHRADKTESSFAPAARLTGGFRADYGFIITLDDEIRRDPERDDTDEIYGRCAEAQDARSVLSAHDADRNTNGDDNHNSGMGVRRTERVAKEYTYPDFMKCQPLNFKGTEGVFKLIQWIEKMETVFSISNCSVENQIKFSTCTLLAGALTWWNSHVRTVGHDVAYAMTWAELKKKMTDKYCPRGEMKKLEAELWNLKVKGTDVIGYNHESVGDLPNMIHESLVSSKPKTMQDTIEMRHNTGRAYTVESGEKKPYGGSKPMCPKYNYHHDGPCAPKCHKCNRVGHLARDCKSPANANTGNNQRGAGAGQKPTCYECGAHGHFKRECLKLKNNNRGNQGGNGNALAKVYAAGRAGTNPDLNVVTGTFLLNNHYASVLFDIGVDRSFVSTAFSSQIDITPSTIDHYYDVELADGRIIGLNAIIRGCTLNFLNHPFNIDLMPVELGSLDVIIGMDWLAKYQAIIVCAEKIIRIPWGNETLIVCGDGSDRGNKTRLNIISCTKTQKYMLKGYPIFLAHVTTKETEDKSEKK
ncbi:reverse transcriptase domain-containing protein [Tanacetum coccineum]